MDLISPRYEKDDKNELPPAQLPSTTPSLVSCCRQELTSFGALMEPHLSMEICRHDSRSVVDLVTLKFEGRGNRAVANKWSMCWHAIICENLTKPSRKGERLHYPVGDRYQKLESNI